MGKATKSSKYVAIAADLRERILDAQLAPHTLMPSERELGELNGVSRMTARQALALLEREGFVYRRPPRGTFVAEPRVRFRIGSFTQEAERMGQPAHAEVLWAEEATPDRHTLAALGLPEGGLVHSFGRLRFMGTEPIAVETTWVPAELTPGITERALEGSLWTLLKSDYGIRLTRSDAVLESIVMGESTTDLLKMRNASQGILLTRRSYDDSGRCVEFAKDTYRADRIAFEVSASLNPDR